MFVRIHVPVVCGGAAVVLDADLLARALLSLSHGRQDRFLVDPAELHIPLLVHMCSRCIGASSLFAEAKTNCPTQSPASSARSRGQSA